MFLAYDWDTPWGGGGWGVGCHAVGGRSSAWPVADHFVISESDGRLYPHGCQGADRAAGPGSHPLPPSAPAPPPQAHQPVPVPQEGPDCGRVLVAVAGGKALVGHIEEGEVGLLRHEL